MKFAISCSELALLLFLKYFKGFLIKLININIILVIATFCNFIRMIFDKDLFTTSKGWIACERKILPLAFLFTFRWVKHNILLRIIKEIEKKKLQNL